MNLKEEVLREHSKAQVMRLVAYIGADAERFDEAMKLFLEGDYRVTQRISWVVSHCASAHSWLIMPYMEPMLQNLLQNPNLHDAVKRNTVRILQFVEIPEDLQGLAAEVCFQYLNDSQIPVAIRAFSMTVLGKIAQQHPDLQEELKIIVEDQLPYQSPAFVSRAKRILKS